MIDTEALVGDLWNNKCPHKDHSVWLDCGECVEALLLTVYKRGWNDAPSLDEKNHKAAWILVEKLEKERDGWAARAVQLQSAIQHYVTQWHARHSIGCSCVLCSALLSPAIAPKPTDE